MTVGTEEKRAFAPEVHVIGIDELMAKWAFGGGEEGGVAFINCCPIKETKGSLDFELRRI